MPHFFIGDDLINPPEIIISNADNYKHIARSLRARVGEKLLLIDDKQIQYETVITESPLRSDAQLTVMEKATELGVRAVFPVITDNCALKVDKHEKWQRVMYEASKQCERAKIPTCYPVTTLENVLKQDFDCVIVFAERSTERSLKTFLRENPIKKGDKVLVIIGPEGGFSEREFEFFRAKGLPLITLGDLILKAETAVIVGLGDIAYEYQE